MTLSLVVSYLGCVHVTQQKTFSNVLQQRMKMNLSYLTSPGSFSSFSSVWCPMNIILFSCRSSWGPVAWWWPPTLSSSSPSLASSWCLEGETTLAGSSGRPSVNLWPNRATIPNGPLDPMHLWRSDWVWLIYAICWHFHLAYQRVHWGLGPRLSTFFQTLWSWMLATKLSLLEFLSYYVTISCHPVLCWWQSGHCGHLY